ncbi:putative subtilisin [Stachybotrys elegans]|uniref:Subtilisin n=1 Tax=Stachybotrys elegans TaxID=80388 RepID=A0A8K0WNH6_9HYPO|nr:putative subtilisin [Stachybotrys elegans]
MVRVSLLASLLAAVAVGSATEHVRRPSGKPRSNIVPGAYIIEFEDGQNKDSFRLQSEPDYDVVLDLSSELFQGASIQLHDVKNAEEAAARLASLPAVKRISPVGIIGLPEPVEEEEENATATSATRKSHRKRQSKPLERARSTHVMTQVDKVHAEGFTGAGIKIAIVDSGIEYTHPALGGCFGEGCLVTHGWDFVGNSYGGIYDEPVPGPDPIDCNGHGTHVAGIIAAQENELGILGAAPGVTLSAYRVFGCEGNTRSDIVMAAFTRAYEEGADIITASLGSSSGWPSEMTSLLVSRIVERGVPCTVAAGNTGGTGMWDVSSPAVGNGVTAVGSFQNTAVARTFPLGSVTMDGNSTRTTFIFRDGYPSGQGASYPVWVTGFDTDNTGDGCSALPDDTPDLSGYWVLLRYASDCDVQAQADNIAAKGAERLIIYNDRPGLRWLAAYTTSPIQAVVSIEEQEGVAWVQALEAGLSIHVDISYDAQSLYLDADYEIGGAASRFSSIGPSFEMDLVPRFGAPGGNIMSTWIGDESFRSLSGTSMATPLVAASIALIFEARGRLSPAELNDLLSSNANPQVHVYEQRFAPPTWYDWFSSVALQGAGLIQVHDAIHASTLLSPSGLSFNDTTNFAGTLNFTLSNTDNADVVYDISHAPARSIYSFTREGWAAGYPYNYSEPHAELAFSESKVKISPGGSATILVTATPPHDLDESRFPVWSGYIAINGSDGSSLSLPYQGLLGSLYDAEQILEGSLYIGDSTNYAPVSPNATFTLPPRGTPPRDVNTRETAVPILMSVFNWGTPQFIADVVPVGNCAPNSTLTSFGYRSIGQLNGFPSNWQPKGEWSWPWLGQLNNGEYAPPGRYKIVTRMLRITGDPDKDEDWVVTETGPFGIRYSS